MARPFGAYSARQPVSARFAKAIDAITLPCGWTRFDHVRSSGAVDRALALEGTDGGRILGSIARVR